MSGRVQITDYFSIVGARHNFPNNKNVVPLNEYWAWRLLECKPKVWSHHAVCELYTPNGFSQRNQVLLKNDIFVLEHHLLQKVSPMTKMPLCGMIQYLALDKTMDMAHNTELLLEAAKNGDLNEVQRLIPISDPKHHCSAALHAAIENDHIECVKALIPVSSEYSFALEEAAQHNKVECVKLLLPLSDDHEMALHVAAANNHIECVKLLLPGSNEVGGQLCLAIQNHHNDCAQLILSDCLQKDTSYMKEWALHTAVEFGNTEAVKMLLPFVDPSIKGSQALALAVCGENQECFDLLYPLSDPTSAFKFVEQSFGHKASLFQSFQDTIERAKAEQQRNVLHEEVSGNKNSAKHKQKM